MLFGLIGRPTTCNGPCAEYCLRCDLRRLFEAARGIGPCPCDGGEMRLRRIGWRRQQPAA